MADLDRDAVIQDLKQLASADDAEALAAARSVVAKVAAAGADWDDLLAPRREEVEEEGDEEEEEEEEEAQEPDGDAGEPPPVGDGTFAAELAIITKLLARPRLFEATRDELTAYREDIAAGEFDEADRKYLQALNARLPKARKPSRAGGRQR